MRSHVIFAVFKRNLASYFSGVLGYLFIVVFVVAGAFLAFNSQFFSSNLATLDQLSARFPLLLLFIVPAITMTVWADERKLGTDELLFTLPASDFEILLGKYLAVLAVYTVSLLFSLTHVLVLSWLGDPDWGLIATTYLGYWLAGAALLSAGMFASVLTSNATVAFVLGAAICAIPVFIDEVPGISGFLKNQLEITEPLSVSGHLKSFTAGKVTFSGLFYFVGLTCFFLYLNAVMISRRHWAGGKESQSMTSQFLLRIGCLGIALLALTYSLAVAGGSFDATSERLHTLSPTTRDMLGQLPRERPVTIQAFLSPDVPQEFVAVRKDLINKLAEFDQRGGAAVQVRIVDVEPFSSEAEQAESLGIRPRQVQSDDNGRLSVADIYLGVVISSGFDTVVIPFFNVGTPMEYELTRSVETVSHENRKTIGILATDARVLGGMDMQTFRRLPKWQIAQELEKQYDVIEISPDEPITEEIEVLIAFMPSSLTEPQMQNLVDYVTAGKPVLIFDDPAPIFGPGGFSGAGISLAPLEAKPSPGGPMGGMQQGEPKADNGEATSLLQALGIRWNVRHSLFDTYNPHPRFAEVFQPELTFLQQESFNNSSPISSGLQEMIIFSPGYLSGRDSKVDVEWLLRSRTESTGVNNWEDITFPGIFGGRQYSFEGPHRPDSESYIIAARIRGNSDEKKVNAIFVADLDLVHDVMFDVWQRQVMDLKIDNVLFVLNCVDALAGDDRLIDLRKRRAVHRTLTTLEAEKRNLDRRLSEETAAADEQAARDVEAAQKRLQEVLDKLLEEMQAGSVDAATLQVRMRNAQAAENRKLTQQQEEIDRKKDERIRQVRNETAQEVRRIERRIWRWAILIPPLPAIILGLGVVLMRLLGERQGIDRDRLR